jgi:hypothetical protein
MNSWWERWNIKINEGKLRLSISPEDLGRGHTKKTGNLKANRDFRELLSTWVEHMLVNGVAQIEETAMQLAGRPRNSISRHRSMPVFSQLRCRVVS